ncbi:MAG: hypothetical protein EA426_03075 [Spirochaetaceae bacterium]|nr:MAG: hypothetical protein EA426_03075 [Spirochaetaceae bacterium]
MAGEQDSGETIQTIIDELGMMVTLDEIVSFMKQALYYGKSVEDALDECLRAPAPVRANARQAAAFRAAARAVWQDLQKTYDRTADEPVVELRDILLALVQRQTDWIRSLDQRGIEPQDLPSDRMQILGEIGAMLTASLGVLEHDASADLDTIDAMLDSLRSFSVIMDQQISAVEMLIDDADDE